MSLVGNATGGRTLYGKIHTINVDDTLSVSGACAEAKVTGDFLRTLDTRLTDHNDDSDRHITAEERSSWNNKAPVLHAARHATGGKDPITPAQIGAYPAIEDTNFPGCYYAVVNGTKEWINPPVVLGEEYRTTERHQNKAVYKQFFELGSLPNASHKAVDVAFSPTCILGHESYFKKGDFLYSGLTGLTIYVAAYGGTPMVNITATGDNSEFNGYITVKYTKD